MFWVVDSLTMRKLKTAKSLDDSCDVTPVKGDASPWPVDEESRVRTAKRCKEGVFLQTERCEKCHGRTSHYSWNPISDENWRVAQCYSMGRITYATNQSHWDGLQIFKPRPRLGAF